MTLFSQMISRAAHVTALGLIILLLLILPTFYSYGQASQELLPPVTFVCPMSEHSEVVEEQPGRCPICRMALQPVRLDLAWSCPLHPAVILEQEGLCPIDGRNLVRVTIARYWTCPDKPRERLTEPGACTDGTLRTAVREHRAHGDHNPRHGGLFFMASDKWHHLEGTYPAVNLFRLFIYDNFTDPLPVGEVTGRLVLREERNPNTGKWEEVDVVPLQKSRNGQTLEAEVLSTRLPLTVTAKLKFESTSNEERFDFTFSEYSEEPAVSPAPTASSPTPQNLKPNRSTPPPTTASNQPQAETQASPASPQTDLSNQKISMSGNAATYQAFLTNQLTAALPKTSPALLDLLQLRARELGELIERGRFGSVYVPAMLCKEVALALENYTTQLPSQRRSEAMAAIRRVVITAWEIDGYGDTGDGQKLKAAYNVFINSVTALETAYGSN